MSLRSVLQNMHERPIRAVRAVQERDEGRIGPPELSELQLSRRLLPILPMLDSGESPVPERLASAVERARAYERDREEDDDA